MNKLFAALLICLPGFALAHDYKAGDLMVMHPVAKETTENAKTSAGYFIVTNTGDTTDTLVGVEANFPRVMMHNTTVTDGVASMNHMGAVEIAPGETITFEPGGMHVMFMGLSEQLVEGTKVPGTLIFENAGRLEIEFNVEAIDAMKSEDHSNH